MTDETDTNKRKPFLDLMISDNKLSDKELREEVDTIMFAVIIFYLNIFNNNKNKYLNKNKLY